MSLIWTLLENGDPEEFLFFVRNFNMIILESVTLATDTKVQYIRTLVPVEALRQFDLLYADVEVTNQLTAENIILGLACTAGV